jgi:hypothetical protein
VLLLQHGRHIHSLIPYITQHHKSIPSFSVTNAELLPNHLTPPTARKYIYTK